VRWAPVLLLTLVACNDLRGFRGDWRGHRVGDVLPLYAGIGSGAVEAELSIDTIDSHGLAARLSIEGLLPETPITSLAGAEADVLAGLTFAGSPLRVYLAFAAVPGPLGEALVIVALYDDRRVEVRILRGGSSPLYGIFALTESEPAT
jgi:hypothetical protein